MSSSKSHRCQCSSKQELLQVFGATDIDHQAFWFGVWEGVKEWNGHLQQRGNVIEVLLFRRSWRIVSKVRGLWSMPPLVTPLAIVAGHFDSSSKYFARHHVEAGAALSWRALYETWRIARATPGTLRQWQQRLSLGSVDSKGQKLMGFLLQKNRLALVLHPKLSRDDCGEPFLVTNYSTLWPSTMWRCYNLMSLGLRTQGRVWCSSAGNLLSGNRSALFTQTINRKRNLANPKYPP